MQSTSLSHSPSQNCWRIEVAEKISRRLAVDAAIVGGATDQGSVAPTLMESRVYYLKGGLDRDEVLDICRRLLCDPVVEKYEISGQQSAVSSEGSVPSPQSSVLSPQPPVLSPQSSVPSPQPFPTIEILPKPGVMDPVALSAERAIRDLGFDIQQVRTGRSYACANVSDPGVARRIAERALANTLIEEIHYSGFEEKYELRSTNYERRKKEEQERSSGQPATWFDPFMETAPYQLEVKSVPICGADDRALLAVSSEGHLFLNIEEMQAIRAHYHRLEREPTDIELETFAQTWSEHCVHKTMRSEVRYRGADFPEELRITNYELRNPGSIEQKYGNLLADTIVAATRELNKPWCLSVFEDNAGIIEFDADHGIAFKVETHNHPTALAPYGGAATGIGGCIRDIMGCGLGAKPFANTDVFCFASPDLPHARLPAGVIHPARTMREVVRGVRDYGNRMGIPTVNGAIVFDDRYLGNPLVYCGCAGLIPKERIEKEARQGDRIVLLGGRTGRDGIHGATFSSGAMSGGHVDEFAHAVQIGNAITEKMVLDVLLQARDHERGCLYRSITDCGAGGLSSAVGEMAAELGAVVELDKVPLKYAGLRYDEIWISEAQERMVLAVAEENVDELLRLCRAEDVEATDIGCFGGDGELVLKYEGQVVGQLDVEFLHNGLPKTVREATWQPTNAADGAPVCESARAEACGSLTNDVRSALLDHLSSPNIASKEWVIRQYDHEVQGGSVIKPLMGPGRGPSDGAVVRPLLNSPKAVALSCGLCPHLSELDPYVMAIAAVDEAVRNNICVGGDMDRMAILDNFCWGDTSEPQVLGALVRAAQGCHDAALAFGIPFISGKDSLNNVFDLAPEEAQRLGWPERISVPGTLLISAISVVSDSARCRTSDLKEPGNKLLLVEPNGSRIVDLAAAARAVGQFLRAVEGLRSCHDVSEGGWLAAAAEMAIGSRYGLRLSRVDESFFDERLGCYLIEVRPDAVDGVAQHREVRVSEVGVVVEQPELRLDRDDGGVVWQVTELRRAWRQTFDWK